MFHRNSYIKYGLLIVLAVVAITGAPPAARTVFNTYAAAKDRKLPIYSVDTPEKKVSISFDAAWGADDTETLLQILKDNEVLTTFFLCGYWVDKHPDEVKKIAAAGHDIGNHGNTHAHGAQLSLAQNKKEIMDCHEKIKAVTGIEANLFRPPYGEYNNTVITAAEETGYHVIQWDVDSHDWMKKGEQYEINRVLNNKALQNGSIILFHNDAPNTPKTLDRIIKGLKEKGYEIVPLSQLIHRENYYMDHTGRQKVKAP
jgi:polysaccharide deacetylase family sporulation protein PdaB